MTICAQLSVHLGTHREPPSVEANRPYDQPDSTHRWLTIGGQPAHLDIHYDDVEQIRALAAAMVAAAELLEVRDACTVDT